MLHQHTLVHMNIMHKKTLPTPHFKLKKKLKAIFRFGPRLCLQPPSTCLWASYCRPSLWYDWWPEDRFRREYPRCTPCNEYPEDASRPPGNSTKFRMDRSFVCCRPYLLVEVFWFLNMRYCMLSPLWPDARSQNWIRLSFPPVTIRVSNNWVMQVASWLRPSSRLTAPSASLFQI